MYLIKLHGKHKTVVDMTSRINTVKLKLQQLSLKLQFQNVGTFPSIASELERQAKQCAQLDSNLNPSSESETVSEPFKEYLPDLSIAPCQTQKCVFIYFMHFSSFSTLSTLPAMQHERKACVMLVAANVTVMSSIDEERATEVW